MAGVVGPLVQYVGEAGGFAREPREGEVVGPDLNDADDPVVDVQAQLEHREGLDVADHLLGRLAGLGQHVDLVGDGVGPGHDACRDYPGESLELVLELRQETECRHVSLFLGG